jgi:hypothetical protein
MPIVLVEFHGKECSNRGSCNGWFGSNIKDAPFFISETSNCLRERLYGSRQRYDRGLWRLVR